MSSTLRKKLKRKAQQKDYKRRVRIFKNRPSVKIEEKVPVFKQTGERDRSGKIKLDKNQRPLIKKIGEKIITIKQKTRKLSVMTPLSRKYVTKEKVKKGAPEGSQKTKS